MPMSSDAPPDLPLTTPLAERIAALQPAADPEHPPEVLLAVALAKELMNRANALQTPQERKQQMELDRMVQHPADKTTLMQITDQTFRSERSSRSAEQLIHILDVQGVPRFFVGMDRLMLKGFQSFGNMLPGVAVPLIKEKMRNETANVILPAENGILEEHLRQRNAAGLRMNTSSVMDMSRYSSMSRYTNLLDRRPSGCRNSCCAAARYNFSMRSHISAMQCSRATGQIWE